MRYNVIEERTPREAPTTVEFATAAAFCVPLADNLQGDYQGCAQFNR